MKIEIRNKMLRSARSLPLISLVVCSFVLSLMRPAIGAELITNGSFETGTFAGWTATNATNPWFPWQAVTAGFDTGFNVPTSPQDGLRTAFQGIASDANSPFTLDQQFTIPVGTATLRWRHRYQLDNATFCTGAACGTATYSVQILNTSNVVLQTLFTTTTANETIVDTGWQVNFANLAAYSGQTIKIRFRTVVTATFAGPGSLQIDAVSVQAPGIFTAATASVSGRALNTFGRGISRAVVSLRAADGSVRTAVTNPFGNYRFEDVQTGETYILSITDKRYLFGDPTRVVTVTDDLSDVDFTALF